MTRMLRVLALAAGRVAIALTAATVWLSRGIPNCRTKLRDQVEIDALGVELVAAVQAAVQPSRTLLWMRERA